MHNLEYKGAWYLPGKSKKKINGTLKFTTSEGAYLDLHGALRNTDDLFEVVKPDIILGVSSKDEHITLYKCFETNYTGSTSKIFANMVLVGMHFSKVRDIKFNALYLQHVYINDWAYISNINLSWNHDTPGFLIRYNQTVNRVLLDKDDYKITLEITGLMEPTAFREVMLRQINRLRVDFKRERSLEESLDFLRLLQNFVSFATMRPMLQVTIDGIRDRGKIGNKTSRNTSARIYSQPLHTTEEIAPLYDMLFTFTDTGDQISQMLANWIEKAELLEPIYNLYFGVLYSPFMYIDQKFLIYAQALESYHRRICGGKYRTDEEYLQSLYSHFVNAIPPNIERDFRVSIANKFKYLHEYGLRRRLRELLTLIRPCLPERFLASQGERKAFVDIVVGTRNYLTHYDEGSKASAAPRSEMNRLTDKLKLVLDVCLLKELGFTEDTIKALVTRNRNYRPAL